jgi:hypothetical protein
LFDFHELTSRSAVTNYCRLLENHKALQSPAETQPRQGAAALSALQIAATVGSGGSRQRACGSFADDKERRKRGITGK